MSPFDQTSSALDPKFLPPARLAEHRPLSVQLRDAAETLAERINGGEFAALGMNETCDLRGLSLQLLEWADIAEAMEAERRPAITTRQLRRGRGWTGRLLRRFGLR